MSRNEFRSGLRAGFRINSSDFVCLKMIVRKGSRFSDYSTLIELIYLYTELPDLIRGYVNASSSELKPYFLQGIISLLLTLILFDRYRIEIYRLGRLSRFINPNHLDIIIIRQWRISKL
jgi:hypothetical protein